MGATGTLASTQAYLPLNPLLCFPPDAPPNPLFLHLLHSAEDVTLKAPQASFQPRDHEM